MIYTQFGSAVEVVDYDVKSRKCKIRRYSDNKEFEVHISILKADGGMAEIENAISQFHPKSTHHENTSEK